MHYVWASMAIFSRLKNLHSHQSIFNFYFGLHPKWSYPADDETDKWNLKITQNNQNSFKNEMEQSIMLAAHTL